MLLCIDCGNTNTVFSVWDGESFRGTFRASTEHQRTADQYYVWLSTLMEVHGLDGAVIDEVIISSTVPRVVFNLRVLADRYFNTRPLVVGKPECLLPTPPRTLVCIGRGEGRGAISGVYAAGVGSLHEELLELAGGVRSGHRLKAVIPGGSSMPVLPADVIMDCDMDYDSLVKAGSALGSGAVIVMDDTNCMVKVLDRISYFYYEESCGQCTPCREGTGWMHRVVRRIETGKGRQEDLDLLDDVAKKIMGRTICALGDAAAMPVTGFIKHFRDEFQYHIDNKRCMV